MLANLDVCMGLLSFGGVCACQDFGLGFLMEREDIKLKTFCGTLEYAAPEMVGKRGYVWLDQDQRRGDAQLCARYCRR